VCRAGRRSPDVSPPIRHIPRPLEVAIDQLVGPIYHSALIADAAVDDDLLVAIVDGVVRDDVPSSS
jgi:hypothetical protein